MGDTPTAGRREVLTRLTAAGSLAVLAAACGSALSGATTTGLDMLPGTWLVDVPSLDHKALEVYLPGGLILGVPSLPTSQFSTHVGTWRETGHGTYGMTVVMFTFDVPSGQPTGVLRIRQTATLDNSGQRLNGTAKLEFQSVGVTRFQPNGSASFTAVRVKQAS